MPAAQNASTPRAFALRNLDAAGKPVEPKRYRDPVAAMYKAIELRTGCRATTRGPKPTGVTGDGQVRDVVGLDDAGNAWTIKYAELTRENMTGWALDRRISAPVTATPSKRTRAHLTLVK